MNGFGLAVFISISGKLLDVNILSADINLVGYNVTGQSNLSMSVNPNNLFIMKDGADPLPVLVITPPYFSTALLTIL